MTPQPFTPRLDAGAVPVWKTRMEEFAASGQPLSPSEGALTREEFGVVVRATCAEASVRHETTIIGLDPGSSLEVSVHESAARIAEEVLTELRALPVPDGAQDRIESVFDVMDEQLDVLEQLADAAAAGDAALIEELVRRRIDLTRRKDDLGGSDFRHCPISLPA